MRKYVLAAILMVGIFSPALAQENLLSTIREVTVYSHGAMVKREGTINIGQGIHDLLIELQAFSIDKDSISARVFGEGEIQSVQYREIPVTEPSQDNIKSLEERLKKLKESKRPLTNEKDLLDKKELFLTSLMKSPAVPPGTHEIKTVLPKVQDLDQMLAFLTLNFKAINDARIPLDIKLEELDKQIAVTERELDALKGPRQKTKKVIQVTFNSKKQQRVRAETSYLVPRATWQPLYKVSVPSDLKEADLIMFASIKQNSGEEWKNVTLTISNVVPTGGSAPPEPRTWFLDIRRPETISQAIPRMVAPKAAPSEAPVPEAKVEAAIQMEPAGYAYAERAESPLSFEYQLSGEATVQSGDRETLAPLFSKTLTGEFLYYTVPKANPLTFLVCKLKTDKELIRGPVNTYFGGRFVGKTFITEKKAGEDFQVSVGAVREVKVAREKVRDKIKETSWGFDRNKVVRDIAYKITVENLKERTVKISVMDTIPVSRTDRIEVKDLKVTPDPSDKSYQNREGVYAWNLEVKPGSKQEISVEFTVTYPKDAFIIGL
jgi:uncharacterized protein (TIGR02231 family)